MSLADLTDEELRAELFQRDCARSAEIQIAAAIQEFRDQSGFTPPRVWERPVSVAHSYLRGETVEHDGGLHVAQRYGEVLSPDEGGWEPLPDEEVTEPRAWAPGITVATGDLTVRDDVIYRVLQTIELTDAMDPAAMPSVFERVD